MDKLSAARPAGGSWAASTANGQQASPVEGAGPSVPEPAGGQPGRPRPRLTPADLSMRPTGTMALRVPLPIQGQQRPEMATPERDALLASTRARRAVLARLETEFRNSDTREVDPGLAATLINELRHRGRQARVGAEVRRAATNDEAMARLTGEHLQAWLAAQGITPDQAASMRRAAFMSGLLNPSGSFVTNALQFVASPWLGWGKDAPWDGAALGLATSVATAPLNALQQTLVVATAESMRERGGPVVVPDRRRINDRHFLPELAREVEQRVIDFGVLHEELARFANQHEVPMVWLNERLLQHPGDAAALLAAALAPVPPERRPDLRRLSQRLVEAEGALHVAQRDFLMTQGAHDRQWAGNAWQALPRTLRSPAAGMLSLLGKLGSGVAGPAAQTVASLVITAGQHLAAGFDERNKQEFNNKLNLLYGDCLTPPGHAKIARGEPVVAQDIDTAKLRAFMQFPARSFAQQVSKQLGERIDALRAEIGEGRGAAPATPEVLRRRADLQVLERDVGRLRAGDLTRLTAGGDAERLLLAAERGVLSEPLGQRVASRYTLREFSAQTTQRAGQLFHLGVLGSAVPAVTGKVVSASLGGVRKAPVSVVSAVAGLSGVMAAIGATSTHTAITVKNNRREADHDVGLGRQFLRGMAGGLSEGLAQRQGTRASRAINRAMADERVNVALDFAHALARLPAGSELIEAIPLAQAARHLNATVALGQGPDAIAIEMPPPERDLPA